MLPLCCMIKRCICSRTVQIPHKPGFGDSLKVSELLVGRFSNVPLELIHDQVACHYVTTIIIYFAIVVRSMRTNTY